MMSTRRRLWIDVSLLVLVNTMWAAQYTAYKKATEQMGPVTVSVWTFVGASLILLPFLKAHAGGHSWPSLRTVLMFAQLGLLGLIPSSACLAWGTALSTASNAAILYLTIPVLTAILAPLMVGERMTLPRWISLGVALGGVLILSAQDLRQMNLAGQKYLKGNLLVLAACLSSAYFNVYTKGLLRRFSSIQILIFGYWSAVLLSVPLLVWAEPVTWQMIRSYTPVTWLSVAVLSLVSWGLAMVLFLYLLTRLDVTQASVSVYLLPFLGVLIAALTLGEPVTPDRKSVV